MTERPCESQVELFMATYEQGAKVASEQAKLVCQQCTVRKECLARAFERREDFGVWGGLTPRERRREQRRDRARRAAAKKQRELVDA